MDRKCGNCEATVPSATSKDAKWRHGKGEHSERPALLKSYVLFWLEQFEQVLAFHSAPANRGGAGVTLALLRKSTGASQKTREFFHERSRAQR